MKLPVPENGIFQPFLLRKPEQMLNLRADVKFRNAIVERGNEGDGGDILDQRAELRLIALALTNVANHARREDSAFRQQRTETDFHWELGTVFPTPEQFQFGPHGPAAGLLEVAVAVTDVAFHPTDERTLASAGTDGTIRIWDFTSGQTLGTLTGSPSDVRLRLAYIPDGRRLAVASGDRKEVSVWDVATAKEISSFTGSAAALCVAYSPDGQHVASAGMEFVVRVWDAATGNEKQALMGHEWPVHGVAFSPDGRRLASCSADTTVRIWDLTTGQELRVLEPRHSARVQNVAFSRDGKFLASAGWDRTVKVWETETWKLVHNLRHSSGAAAQCVAFGRDSRRLAWGSADGTVKVWDGPGTETHVLRGHTSWVQAVAFSPDDKWIASASLDGRVKIWKAPAELKAPIVEGEVDEN